MSDYTSITVPNAEWDGPHYPDGPVWTPLLARPMTVSLLNVLASPDPYTGATTRRDFEQGPDHMSDLYTGYQVTGSRYFQATWNQMLGDAYGGGHPDQDRFYEWMTDPSEPFPTTNVINGPFGYYTYSHNNSSWYGYKGGGTGGLIPEAKGHGNWRRYAVGNTGSGELANEPGFNHKYKWMSVGYTWWDAFPISGLFAFGDNRETHVNYDTAVSVRRIDELTDVRSYELMNASQLKSSISSDVFWGQNALGTFETLGGAQYENRKYIAIEDTGATLLDRRLIFRIRNDSARVDTTDTGAGTPEKFYVYAKTTAPTQTYPWSTWSGTLIGEINLTYGSATASTFSWYGGSKSTEVRYVTGASFSFGTSVTTRFEDAGWTTYVIEGLTFPTFQQGNYIELQIIPYHYFNEPAFSANMTTGATSAQTAYHHSSNMIFSVDWETRVSLPRFWYLIPSVTTYPWQDFTEGYGTPTAINSSYVDRPNVKPNFTRSK